MFINKSEYQLMKSKQSLSTTSEAVVILLVFSGVRLDTPRRLLGTDPGNNDPLEGVRLHDICWMHRLRCGCPGHQKHLFT